MHTFSRHHFHHAHCYLFDLLLAVWQIRMDIIVLLHVRVGPTVPVCNRVTHGQEFGLNVLE